MTLNITVLTSDLIYQSADFRITGRPTHNRSPKIVSLAYRSFSGFVTYTGIGSIWNKDTSQWITEWLTGPPDVSMAEVANLLQTKGTKLVADARPSTGRLEPMTFILAGFEEGKPIVYVASNVEDISGRGHPAERDLKISYRRIGKNRKATVIATGSGKAYVSPADKKRLAYMAARSPHDSGLIRRRLETIHLAAGEAEKQKGKYTISPHCMVVSLRSDGSGVLRLDQSAPEIPSQFPRVVFGMNTTKIMSEGLRAVGIDPSKARVVQGASASMVNGEQPKAVIPPCRFTVASPDPTAGYRLSELVADGCPLSRACAINDSGLIVGTADPHGDRTYYAPWIWNDKKAMLLDFPGAANDINGSGEVALTLQAAEDRNHACIYAGGNIVDLHSAFDQTQELTATHSSATAINDAGLVGGGVQDRSGQDGERNPRSWAVYFQPMGMVVALKGPGNARSCRTVDINRSGTLLVMAGIGPFNTRCILWNTADKTMTHVGGPDSNAFPIAITDSGSVLGQANNERGQKVAIICPPAGNWQRLGTEDGWSPVDINNSGDVVGRVQIDGIDRPWLRLSTGQLILLPYLVNHNTIPTSINNVGKIVGASHADHGSHAILWQLSSPPTSPGHLGD